MLYSIDPHTVCRVYWLSCYRHFYDSFFFGWLNRIDCWWPVINTSLAPHIGWQESAIFGHESWKSCNNNNTCHVFAPTDLLVTVKKTAKRIMVCKNMQISLRISNNFFFCQNEMKWNWKAMGIVLKLSIFDSNKLNAAHLRWFQWKMNINLPDEIDYGFEIARIKMSHPEKKKHNEKFHTTHAHTQTEPQMTSKSFIIIINS